MLITVEIIMTLRPCLGWHRERLQELVGKGVDTGDERAFEVMSGMPKRDARWLLARLLDDDGRVEWADACARRGKEYAANAAYAYAAANTYAANAAANAFAANVEHHVAIRHALLILSGRNPESK